MAGAAPPLGAGAPPRPKHIFKLDLKKIKIAGRRGDMIVGYFPKNILKAGEGLGGEGGERLIIWPNQKYGNNTNYKRQWGTSGSISMKY